MALTIDKKKVNSLVDKLRNHKSSGLSMEDSLRALYQNVSPMVVITPNSKRDLQEDNFESPSPAEFSLAAFTVYEEITPLKIAVLTKELFETPEAVVESVLGSFPNYTALEMGTLLLNDELFPQMISIGMQEALAAGDQGKLILISRIPVG